MIQVYRVLLCQMENYSDCDYNSKVTQVSDHGQNYSWSDFLISCLTLIFLFYIGL